MAELTRFWGIVIAIFFRGEVGRHNRPHIHAIFTRGEEEASIALDTGEVLAGKLHPQNLRLVRIWMELHMEELQEAWDLARHGKTPYKIAPLTKKVFK